MADYKVLVQKLKIPGDTYYIFVTDPSKLQLGDYVKFTPAKSGLGRTDIIGPEQLLFVREKIVERMGGLEEAVRRIRGGLPLLEPKKNGQ